MSSRNAFKHANARKWTKEELRQMREMWELKVWEGQEVTIRKLAEWFFTTPNTARLIVNSLSHKEK